MHENLLKYSKYASGVAMGTPVNEGKSWFLLFFCHFVIFLRFYACYHGHLSFDPICLKTLFKPFPRPSDATHKIWSSKLLVTRTGIKAGTSLISGQIRLLTLELLALEWRKFYTFELEYLSGHLGNLDQILCVASLGWGKGLNNV